MNKKLNDKYLTQMKWLEQEDDTERAHVAADGILCELLEELGYEELVATFHALYKWYA